MPKIIDDEGVHTGPHAPPGTSRARRADGSKERHD